MGRQLAIWTTIRVRIPLENEVAAGKSAISLLRPIEYWHVGSDASINKNGPVP